MPGQADVGVSGETALLEVARGCVQGQGDAREASADHVVFAGPRQAQGDVRFASGEADDACLHPDYLISEHPDASARFARFDRPAAFYSFTDDAFGPRGSVEALLARLPRANVDHRRVDPGEVGKGPIGHFGFFRARFREPLWREALVFLSDLFEGRSPSRLAARATRFAFELREEEIIADLRHCRGLEGSGRAPLEQDGPDAARRLR